ncbi:1,4-alpha-glucan branching protein GlgB [Marinitenerispora sediminis]|uniref:1,4-alpha-glucan branching enzyme GlgB n=1 Tax=Marinitenerispora sediminis TaxID=1931232 RepID=A0A368T4L9_9ACTN|nr:1,4-alpha-glucan branching protein GlgB [Marinitenerispora sediminis]RCV49780.1 1,4-alpha-glucan branching enzyme [Marinitenerispora sediminis]RCV57156.1 1,4-alpha-glucan branching enzyme [Marinitenerispora sediminis]RCV57885.1 1,4-alpha-glucan branching enzyme [Marinitenerispora sediminis]
MDDALIAEIDQLIAGRHHDPHRVLGAHPCPEGVVLRTLRPLARSVHAVLADGTRLELAHLHGGVFAAVLPTAAPPGGPVPDYRLDVRYSPDEPETLVDDPYRHLPTVGELDLHLIGEGRHEELWRVLGAHTRRFPSVLGETAGTSFAVWAPAAHGVRVIGDFNHWDGTAHPMRSLGRSGVWELFVPGVGDGTRYKYQVLGTDGVWREKADPVAFATERPPATASVVHTSDHRWRDGDWLARRADGDWTRRPMSVYEVHLGSWRPGLSYERLATELVSYVREMGFTHVEFLPVAEHPFGGSWGYQVTSYYAPTSRFGSPDGFRLLIDELHRAGVGVLLDWVPAHFPRDEWALARFDGTPLYEHPDPRRGEHPDWGTLIFDYGRAEVRNFLVANALYWLEEFHIDGLRVDAVASMLYLDYSRESGEWAPNQYGGRENLEAIAFLQELTATAYRRSPGVTLIAEESTAWPGVCRPTDSGGLGFGFKWNMGWMHDTLHYLRRDPVHRSHHHNELTFSMVYAYSENYVLPLSHDEVVHGKRSLLNKMPGDEWQRCANLRALFGYMWAHPGKQLLFMGGEIAQGEEWSHEDGVQWWLLDHPHHAGVRRLVADLNRLYRTAPALWSRDCEPGGFTWIDGGDAAGNTLSFLRHGDDGSVLACLVNFSGTPHPGRRVGLPFAGPWREVLNTDAAGYGGSGVGQPGGVVAEPEPWNGQPASAVLAYPPLATVWLVPGGPG